MISNLVAPRVKGSLPHLKILDQLGVTVRLAESLAAQVGVSRSPVQAQV